MSTTVRRTGEFLRAWLLSPDPVVEREVVLQRGDREVSGKLVYPAVGPKPMHGWVVLHGITRPGPDHPGLRRFYTSLASAGFVAIIPNVPEWRDLRLAPRLTVPTVRAAIAGLRASGLVDDGPLGIAGFSFGAPHAVTTAADPSTVDDVSGCIAFGGYCDLDTTIGFMMTGIHENEGAQESLFPDPYGRWIVAANYLTAVPGLERASDVANAVWELAAAAGGGSVPSWSPLYDPLVRKLRRDIPPGRRGIFDTLAPASDRKEPTRGNGPSGAELAAALTEAARAADPLLDPVEALAGVRRPVHILHGRYDNLIPCSQARRLRAAINANVEARLTVTRLFGHSGPTAFSLKQAVQEVPPFLRAVGGIMSVV